MGVSDIVEFLIFLVLSFVFVLPILLTVRTCSILMEEMEALSVIMDLNVFRKIPRLKEERSRFILFKDGYRFSGTFENTMRGIEFLRISDWTNGGRYYMNEDGFPERVGSFKLEGERREWLVTLTPVIGKINVYRLK